MPVHSGRDKTGPFFQYGKHGKKYYYVPKDKDSRLKAKKMADEQMRAIYFSGYREK